MAGVEKPSGGLTMTNQPAVRGGSGAMRSPLPVQCIVPPRMKNGTSLPSRAAMHSSFSSDRAGAYRVRSASSADAALLLPPPSPA